MLNSLFDNKDNLAADEVLLLLLLLPPDESLLLFSLNRSLPPLLGELLLAKLGLVVCLGTGLNVTEEEGGGIRLPPPPPPLLVLLLLPPPLLLDDKLARLTEVRLTPGRLASFTEEPLKGLMSALLLLPELLLLLLLLLLVL